MEGIRLSERLRLTERLGDKLQRSASADIEDVLHSVVGYVGKILNTRSGSTVIDDDFGIPDFTGLGHGLSRDDIPEMERKIETFISRFEPRLRDVHISFVAQEQVTFEMRFNLRAQLVVRDENGVPVSIMTDMAPNGQVTVRRA